MWKSLSIAALTCIATSAGVSRAETPAFRDDIEKRTEQNNDFRNVLFTGHNIQIVAMALPPGEDIGEEVHKVDQCFFFVEGTAQTVVGGHTTSNGKNSVVCVPAGTRHNIRNSGPGALKLFTAYAPPQHPAGTLQHTKAQAQQAERASHKTGP